MSLKKVRLEVIGLSYSQTQSGAYALVLGEEKGKRRLPIIIGGFEAQAIAIELEKMTPQRPLTHDLFKSFASSFGIQIKEIVIYKLVEGIFFAKIICQNAEKEVDIDARTSDAIALAVRFNCPIYTYDTILSSAGITIEEEEMEEKVGTEKTEKSKKVKVEKEEGGAGEFSHFNLQELHQLLSEAIDQEAYERASNIRDEIKKRSAK
jgi:bifunctional DNase/RNase